LGLELYGKSNYIKVRWHGLLNDRFNTGLKECCLTNILLVKQFRMNRFNRIRPTPLDIIAAQLPLDSIPFGEGCILILRSS
jgi:hypothetical protein